MAFDEKLAKRVRMATSAERGIAEKQMFGGLCFLVHGNLCCGVDGNDLFVRTAPDVGEKLLFRKHAQPFNPDGRPMRGWVRVDRAGVADQRVLRSWLKPALDFAGSLPKKAPGRGGSKGTKR